MGQIVEVLAQDGADAGWRDAERVGDALHGQAVQERVQPGRLHLGTPVGGEAAEVAELADDGPHDMGVE